MANLGPRALVRLSFGWCSKTVSRQCSGSSRVSDVLEEVTKQFESGGVPEARLSAQYLVCSVVSEREKVVPADFACLSNSEDLSDGQKQRLRQLVLARLSRMPIQYILGNWDFHGVTLNMRPPVFIPRPETEELVELILAALPSDKSVDLLEVGPGSGAISLALLTARSDLTITAVDRSTAAVQLTWENAVNLGVQDRLTVVQGRVGDQELDLANKTFYSIISNPPYVLRKDLMNVAPEISLYEDLRALDGGAEGLDVILPILDLASKYLREDGLIFLEVDPCHAHLLPSKLDNFESKFTLEKVVKDFNDKDRFIVLRKG